MAWVDEETEVGPNSDRECCVTSLKRDGLDRNDDGRTRTVQSFLWLLIYVLSMLVHCCDVCKIQSVRRNRSASDTISALLAAQPNGCSSVQSVNLRQDHLNAEAGLDRRL